VFLFYKVVQITTFSLFTFSVTLLRRTSESADVFESYGKPKVGRFCIRCKT